jgi:predicted NBD/HSP70 family sugar kinase
MSAPSPRTHRPDTELRIVDVLRAELEATRATLTERTGLSRATVSALVRDLERDGLVRVDDDGPGLSRSGRRAELVRLTRRAGVVAGVDFGHDHVRVAVSDLAGRVLGNGGARLDVDADMGDALTAARGLLDRAADDAQVHRDEILACGVGVPTSVDRVTGRVRAATRLDDWAGTPLTSSLEAGLELPVVVDADANLGALAEHLAGAGRGIDDLVFVRIDSGVGAGLISGGRPLRGSTGTAGDLGHVVVDPHGAPCRCGRRGCLTTVASAAAVRARCGRPTPPIGRDDDLLRAVQAGDVDVELALAEATRALGRALATVCLLLDPAAIVLGGDPAFSGPLAVAVLEEELRHDRRSDAGRDVRVVPAALGQDAPLVGALRLAGRSLQGWSVAPHATAAGAAAP